MRFSVCWWNTGLVPPRGSRPTAKHIKEVADALRVIFKFRGVDMVCLGEVDTYVLQDLQKLNIVPDLFFEDLSTDDIGSKFHMGAIWRKTINSVEVGESYSVQLGLDRRKGGRRIDVMLIDFTRICIFIVHWPSRLRFPEDSSERYSIGVDLRRVIDGALGQDYSNNVIIMGDFNDEPYNFSISRALSATRDISMVKRDRRLLYNPFWRTLADRGSHGIAAAESNCAGTYYYASGKVHRWVTVDQILFSASFLGGGQWQLCEAETVIWEEPRILRVGPGLSQSIDHLPVFGVMEKTTI